MKVISVHCHFELLRFSARIQRAAMGKDKQRFSGELSATGKSCSDHSLVLLNVILYFPIVKSPSGEVLDSFQVP